MTFLKKQQQQKNVSLVPGYGKAARSQLVEGREKR
jgi:hypothetical protein